MTILWAIQKHPTSPAPKALHDGCQRAGARVVYASWNDSELPELPNEQPLLFYGSCAFIDTIASANRWQPGVYFDRASFRYTRYLAEYGAAMLNSDCVVANLDSLQRLGLLEHNKLFIRSDDDSKTLSGSVWTRDQLTCYIAKLQSIGNHDMLQHPLIASPRKVIDYEWRIFMVNGRISSGSQYRHFGDLCCTREIPPDVQVFAERLAADWSPSEVFVMDIARCNNQLFVLELNGFNSCGFYSSDVTRIVRDVEQLITQGGSSASMHADMGTKFC